jgi:hypothetical protein
MLWGFVFVSFISKELALGQSEYISWVKCTSWLSNFVNLRGLRQPDGRPLYEYHATNDEYTQLTQLLRAVGQSQSNICNRDFAACFVLFCSEWYRRDYERQCGWTWDPIYKKIGISFTATELGTIVPKGCAQFDFMNLNDAIFSEHYSVKVVYLSGYSKNQTVAFWLFSPGSLDNMSKQSSQVFLPFRWQELS